jgi:hypothetical protein
MMKDDIYKFYLAVAVGLLYGLIIGTFAVSFA